VRAGALEMLERIEAKACSVGVVRLPICLRIKSDLLVIGHCGPERPRLETTVSQEMMHGAGADFRDVRICREMDVGVEPRRHPHRRGIRNLADSPIYTLLITGRKQHGATSPLARNST
jgi:hypothetical protein